MSRENKFHHTHEGISIIVPVLNDRENLDKCLHSMQAAEIFTSQVLVADGGSTDGSAELSQGQGYTTFVQTGGRAAQLAAAIEALPAQCHTLVIMHADTIVPRDILASVSAARDAGYRFGCCRRRFIDAPWWVAITDKLAALRAKYFGISYGDQTQWIDRQLLAELGGIPQGRMEDLHLGLAAHGKAGTHVINALTRTSARRLKGKVFAQLWRDNVLAFKVWRQG